MANVTGITETAEKNIIAALQEYSKGITGCGYGFGGVNEFVKGSNAEKLVASLINQMIREMQSEIAVEIAKIQAAAGTLNATYKKMDANTTFKS